MATIEKALYNSTHSPRLSVVTKRVEPALPSERTGESPIIILFESLNVIDTTHRIKKTIQNTGFLSTRLWLHDRWCFGERTILGLPPCSSIRDLLRRVCGCQVTRLSQLVTHHNHFQAVRDLPYMEGSGRIFRC